MTTLSDGVVMLRPFTAEDAPALAEMWRDPTLRARNTVPEPTEQAALEWVAQPDSWRWAVIDLASGGLAGRRALKGVTATSHRGEAACWIGAPFRGRQLAPRSLRLAAAHGFEHGLIRVQASVEADNAASIRSVLAAGMKHEGRLRSYFVSTSGVPVDAEIFSLLADDLAGAPPFRP